MKKVLFLQLRGTPLSPDDGRENVPYAAGCLAAYLKRKGSTKKFHLIIPQQTDFNDWGDERLLNYILSTRPAWISFTLYLWNVERSLYIAAKVKEEMPDCKIVVGGPEVSRDNDWILENKAVDLFVSGEGEESFYRIIEGKEKRRFVEAVHTLNDYDSPYLSGSLKMGRGEPVYIETQRGCPFKCTFCFYPKSGEKIRQLPLKKLEALIKKALKNGVTDLVFTDPTFNNYHPLDDLLDLLIKMNQNKKLRFHAEIKPHMLSASQIKKINRAGFATLEAGLQTIKKSTQKKIKCIIPLEKFVENIDRLSKKISIRLDLISGLPGEGLKDIKASIRYARKHCPTADLYLYHLSVLPGTEMRGTTKTHFKTNFSVRAKSRTSRPCPEPVEGLRPKNMSFITTSMHYQARPPYYVLNNGRIGKEGLRRANEFFEKVTGEELDPELDIEKIYRDRKKCNFYILKTLDSRLPFGLAQGTRGNDIHLRNDMVSLFNVIEFRTKGLNKDEILKDIKEITGKNPYSTFVIFIDAALDPRRSLPSAKAGGGDDMPLKDDKTLGDDMKEEIMRHADLEYAQNINRGRICSRLKIANLYLAYI